MVYGLSQGCQFTNTRMSGETAKFSYKLKLSLAKSELEKRHDIRPHGPPLENIGAIFSFGLYRSVVADPEREKCGESDPQF